MYEQHYEFIEHVYSIGTYFHPINCILFIITGFNLLMLLRIY